jgi:hypothetical protein
MSVCVPPYDEQRSHPRDIERCALSVAGMNNAARRSRHLSQIQDWILRVTDERTELDHRAPVSAEEVIRLLSRQRLEIGDLPRA